VQCAQRPPADNTSVYLRNLQHPEDKSIIDLTTVSQLYCSLHGDSLFACFFVLSPFLFDTIIFFFTIYRNHKMMASLINSVLITICSVKQFAQAQKK
jgi:hypothetical protein